MGNTTKKMREKRNTLEEYEMDESSFSKRTIFFMQRILTTIQRLETIKNFFNISFDSEYFNETVSYLEDFILFPSFDYAGGEAQYEKYDSHNPLDNIENLIVNVDTIWSDSIIQSHVYEIITLLEFLIETIENIFIFEYALPWLNDWDDEIYN